MRFQGVWRTPAKETDDYPGLIVHDGRVSGSITFGKSRLPVWAVIHRALTETWAVAEADWSPSRYGWDAARTGEFLYNLLEQRGEFGRLVCTLADVERRASTKDGYTAWWEIKSQRRRVLRRLRACVAALEALDAE